MDKQTNKLTDKPNTLPLLRMRPRGNYYRHRWEKDGITVGTGGKRTEWTELLQAQVEKGQNYCRHRWEKDRITAGTGGKRTELL